MSDLIKESPFKCMKMPKSSKEVLFRTPTFYGHDLRSQGWTQSVSEPKEPVPEGEVLLFVAVFHPFTVCTSTYSQPV